jgi:hypothetical protein
VRATLPNTSRVTELNPETLVVRVDVSRVRDVLLATGDKSSAISKLALVVALGENVRCLPLTMKMTNRYAPCRLRAPPLPPPLSLSSSVSHSLTLSPSPSLPLSPPSPLCVSVRARMPACVPMTWLDVSLRPDRQATAWK